MRQDDERDVRPGSVERRHDDAAGAAEEDHPGLPSEGAVPHDRLAGGPGRAQAGAEEDQPHLQGDGFEPHDRLAGASPGRLEARRRRRGG